MRRLVVMLTLLAVLAPCASIARADGDPGSDVLVYQRLFIASDAGVSVKQQLELGALLRAAGRAHFPVRVAIISSRYDLGAVTGLWHQPRAYARFLGIELSLAYKGRLLVVMPNGFGFNWPGHSTTAAYAALNRISIGRGGVGLANAAKEAVTSLAADGDVGLRATGSVPVRSGGARTSGRTAGTAEASPSRGLDSATALTVGVLAALVAILMAVRGLLRRRGRSLSLGATVRRLHFLHWARNRPAMLVALLFLAVTAGSVAAITVLHSPSPAESDQLASNPYLDPGSVLSGRAPDFTLTDQFGQPVSLHSFRGKVVILAFNDSECTTVCPLTTTAMLDAKAMLGAAGSRVQLLGVEANPKAISLEDVLSYSQLHGMLHAWHFLTGSLAQLRRVWKAYAIDAEIERGLISHTPALFVIGPDGREAKVYLTQQSYAAIGQLGQILAQEVSSLLPDHPQVHSNLSYARVPRITPATAVSLPRTGGGSTSLGPGRARLSLFFATWNQEITSLAGHLDALNGYQASATRLRLPALSAIDEASVEPSASALPVFLRGLPRPLSYPVAIDRSGRVADGYGVQGQPWFVLTSATGRLLWYWEVSTSGWLSQRALIEHVRAALAGAPKAPANAAAAAAQLAGSPAPLAALHSQAGRVLGPEQSLAARIRALRGYPIVINAWASWCTPCQAEFGLFASASARYGRNVAFLGADTDDSASDAQQFLAHHPVSYPSYTTTTNDLRSLAVIQGLPTTIYIDRHGKVAYVHTGQYASQGSLDADIGSYALGR
jgi:cytochrome oxidase Cu insertion factor (SCO1/SenC/PrrC family)/thiol-disulfide isomerase/thioredoxin